MAAILSAAQWNLMRDPNPRAVMTPKASLVVVGESSAWRGLSGRRLPIEAGDTWQRARGLVDPIVVFNPALGDANVRRTARRKTDGEHDGHLG